MVTGADWSSVGLVNCGHNNFGVLLLLGPGRVRCRRGDERTVEDFAAGEVATAGGVATFVAAPTPRLCATASGIDGTRDALVLPKVSLNDVVQSQYATIVFGPACRKDSGLRILPASNSRSQSTTAATSFC